jgi:hypothetical protein
LAEIEASTGEQCCMTPSFRGKESADNDAAENVTTRQNQLVLFSYFCLFLGNVMAPSLHIGHGKQ